MVKEHILSVLFKLSIVSFLVPDRSHLDRRLMKSCAKVCIEFYTSSLICFWCVSCIYRWCAFGTGNSTFCYVLQFWLQTSFHMYSETNNGKFLGPGEAGDFPRAANRLKNKYSVRSWDLQVYTADQQLTFGRPIHQRFTLLMEVKFM